MPLSSLATGTEVLQTMGTQVRIAFLSIGLLLLCSSIQVSLSQHLLIDRSNGSAAVTVRVGETTERQIPILRYVPRSIASATTEALQTASVDSFTWALKFSVTGKVFKDVRFATPEVGYVVTELGAVYKTTNGGDSWQNKLNLGFPYYWYGVDALTPDTVVIAGFNNQGDIHSGVMRWSYDGGSMWTQDIILSIPAGVGWLDRVHFFNADTGIVMASTSGGVHYTLNGGEDSSSWTYVQINQDLSWFAGNIDPEPSGDVYAAGLHIGHSSDFGISWNTAPPADFTFDGGVDFLDDNHLYGWTGGGQISAPVQGWVHRTTDGGQTWSGRLNTFSYPIRAVKFFSETLGLAAGGNVYGEAGGIYSTTDGGLSWNLDVNTNAEMFSIETVRVSSDSVDIWCAGSTGGSTGFVGKLYKARVYMPGGATDVGTAVNTREGDFKLYDCFPNPFNPVTTIRYQIASRNLVSLKVFNTIGQCVATLVQKMEGPGTMTIRFDATSLSSGVYLCRLEAGNFLQVKKMVLLQ